MFPFVLLVFFGYGIVKMIKVVLKENLNSRNIGPLLIMLGFTGIPIWLPALFIKSSDYLMVVSEDIFLYLIPILIGGIWGYLSTDDFGTGKDNEELKKNQQDKL